MIKKYLKDPLLHFLVLGGLVFALYGYLNGGFDEEKITISKAQIDQLVYRWQKKNFRQPTLKEKEQIVETAIYQKIMSREAIRMGLEKDDQVIKRRLVQKMEFVSSDLSQLAKPTTKELERYLQKNASDYQEPTKVSFLSTYLNPANGNVTKRLNQIKNIVNKSNYVELSDSFLLPLKYDLVTYQELSRRFGKKFSQKLATLKEGSWSEPIKSGYGLHLVYISKKIEGALPPIDGIKQILTNRYMQKQREKGNIEFYKMLKKNYIIEIGE